MVQVSRLRSSSCELFIQTQSYKQLAHISRFAFPSLLLAPPYLFSSSGVGLMEIAALIGFAIACVAGGYLADVITAEVIRRQGGAVFPEQRLIALIPGCLIAPTGCILVAFSCSEKLHWVAIAFGFGMSEHISPRLLTILTRFQYHLEQYIIPISQLPM